MSGGASDPVDGMISLKNSSACENGVIRICESVHEFCIVMYDNSALYDMQLRD